MGNKQESQNQEGGQSERQGGNARQRGNDSGTKRHDKDGKNRNKFIDEMARAKGAIFPAVVEGFNVGHRNRVISRGSQRRRRGDLNF